jgi:hypothetical protein
MDFVKSYQIIVIVVYMSNSPLCTSVRSCVLFRFSYKTSHDLAKQWHYIPVVVATRSIYVLQTSATRLKP